MNSYSKGSDASSRLVAGRLLRRGYTTGSCAAAAAKAATLMLLAQAACKSISLTTPVGSSLTTEIFDAEYSVERASCAVRKDSGDDPDVTNGCLVCACVTFAKSGIQIKGGEGIGVVTKPGLDQPVGAYAINTVPRKQITAECENVCRAHGYAGGLLVVVSIPGGEELALRTFNPRLGIIGGLSVLGTKGVVEPMSESAVVDTFRAQLSVLYQEGHRDVLLTVGNYGEAFARDKLGLSLSCHIKCSNFIGETLSAAAEKGFSRALLIGHIGKLVKLGIGITNTHSSYGDGRMETMAACALEAGAGAELLREILGCATTDAAIDRLAGAELLEQTMTLLSLRIDDTLRRHLAGYMDVGFICFRGMGKNAFRCAQNEQAEKMMEVFCR